MYLILLLKSNPECRSHDTMKEALKTRVLKRIERKRGDVFLRSDFSDLGGYDQVGRALRQLVVAFIREARTDG